MKKFRVLTTALAAAAFLAGCGGSNPGDQSPNVAFTRMVNFGDSLSDVGTYKTTVVAGNGDGKYSINGDFKAQGLPYTNWTEYLSKTLGFATLPCANEVGLASVGALAGLAQPVTTTATCFNYAQGGARVTNPVGPGNAALFTTYGVASGQLGQLTVPLVTQVANFKAVNTFSATDLVTVLAGGNDVFINRGLTVDGTVGQLQALVAAGQMTQADANAQYVIVAGAAVAAMSQAGTELAALIKNEIVGGGATHVVVVNLPDVSLTPDAKLWETTGAGAIVEPLLQTGHQNLTLEMTTAFNNALAVGLFGGDGTAVDSLPQVAWVDAFTQSDAQLSQPATYGLVNMDTPACDLTKTGLTLPGPTFIPLQSSLFCNKSTLIAPPAATVTSSDPTGVMHYLYADTVHPTPFGYRLLAEYVGLRMAVKGWL